MALLLSENQFKQMTINGFPNKSMDQLKKCQTMQTSEFCASIDDDADVDGPCN